MFSLCMKAGALRVGGFTCEKTMQARKAHLVFVCSDASGNTKKKFSQKAFYYGVPYRENLTKETLGRAIGKDCSVLVVTDVNFSGRILELIDF